MNPNQSYTEDCQIGEQIGLSNMVTELTAFTI